MTKLDKIRVELQRLSEMAAEWQSMESISALERDLMLARLRDLYEMMRFEVVADSPASGVVAATATAVAAVSEEEALPEDDVPADALLPDDTLVALDADVLLAFDPLVEEPAFEPEELPVVEEPIETPAVAEEAMADDAEEGGVEPMLGEVQNEDAGEVAAPSEQEVELTAETTIEIAPEPEVEPEVAPEPAPVVEPEVAPETEPKAATAPETPAVSTNLFGEEEQVARHRHKQRVIMSLYDAPATTIETPKPRVEDAPVVSRVEEVVVGNNEVMTVVCEPEVIKVSEDELEEEVVEMPAIAAVEAPAPIETEMPAPVLGEVIQPVQTLADTIAPPRDVASELRYRAPITDLRRAVGINDKFLLIRDLFNGNGSLYEITIRRLNEFDNFDDCMIYIAENFAWNPNTDGAKLMMELLERKFDQQ